MTNSELTILKAVDEAADHFGDRFQLLSEQLMFGLVDQTAPTGDFEKRHALLDGASRDDEEVLPIRLATIAYSEIRRDRKRGAIQLVGEEAEAALEPLSRFGDLIGERDRLLIDLQFLEHEGHQDAAGSELSRRSGEQETAIEQVTSGVGFHLLHLSPALLLSDCRDAAIGEQ
jgi:hypothetical protein